MKKIILEPKERQEIYLDDINNMSIVGIEFKSGNKGIVIVDEGMVYLCTNNGELIPSTFFDSKYQYLKNLIKNNISNAYTFNTVKECFKWMGE